MLTKGLITAAALAALTALVTANDGFMGITSTGLQFKRTDAIAMEREELFIGLDEIKVDYVFRNATKTDVTGTVAFPMPVIHLGTMQVEPARFDAADLDKPNPLNFTATVDGRDVAVATERRAYLQPRTETLAPVRRRAEYDSPGDDVTAYLTSLGIPIAFDHKKVFAALEKLPPASVKSLADRGLATKEDDPDIPWFLRWSIMVRHSWKQTFPAGATVRISHRYKALAEGGTFSWDDGRSKDVSGDPNADDRARYCIDEGTGRAIFATLRTIPEGGPHTRFGTGFNIAYILTTANTWKGPIGSFKLTLDEGAPENVLSLCMEGLRKISPTRFEVTKTNFTPTKDLEILVVSRDSPTLK
jgi:hypothetical protein